MAELERPSNYDETLDDLKKRKYSYEDMVKAFVTGRKHMEECGNTNNDCWDFITWMKQNMEPVQSEGYPSDWKHCMIHLHPKTGEMHSDGEHFVREWIENEIKKGVITTADNDKVFAGDTVYVIGLDNKVHSTIVQEPLTGYYLEGLITVSKSYSSAYNAKLETDKRKR